MCSFCNLFDESPFHVVYECDCVKHLWSDLVQCSENTLTLPTLTPQTAIFGILDSVRNNSFFENNKTFVNHILLIFKLYVYKSREKKFINVDNLIAEIRKFKRIEKEIAFKLLKENNCFYKKMASDRKYIFNNVNGLYSEDFDEETNRLHMKNHLEKWGGLAGYFSFHFLKKKHMW